MSSIQKKKTISYNTASSLQQPDLRVTWSDRWSQNLPDPLRLRLPVWEWAPALRTRIHTVMAPPLILETTSLQPKHIHTLFIYALYSHKRKHFSFNSIPVSAYQAEGANTYRGDYSALCKLTLMQISSTVTYQMCHVFIDMDLFLHTPPSSSSSASNTTQWYRIPASVAITRMFGTQGRQSTAQAS